MRFGDLREDPLRPQRWVRTAVMREFREDLFRGCDPPYSHWKKVSHRGTEARGEEGGANAEWGIQYAEFRVFIESEFREVSLG